MYESPSANGWVPAMVPQISTAKVEKHPAYSSTESQGHLYIINTFVRPFYWPGATSALEMMESGFRSPFPSRRLADGAGRPCCRSPGSVEPHGRGETAGDTEVDYIEIQLQVLCVIRWEFINCDAPFCPGEFIRSWYKSWQAMKALAESRRPH